MKPPPHVEAARAAGHRAWADEVRDAFLEDVEWLVIDGATLDGLCQRLGMSRNLIEKRLRNYGREDLLDQLSRGRAKHGPRELVDAQPAGQQVRELSELGWTDLDLARRVDSSRATIQALKHGWRPTTRAPLMERILAVHDAPPVRLQRISAQRWKEGRT